LYAPVIRKARSRALTVLIVVKPSFVAESSEIDAVFRAILLKKNSVVRVPERRAWKRAIPPLPAISVAPARAREMNFGMKTPYDAKAA